MKKILFILNNIATQNNMDLDYTKLTDIERANIANYYGLKIHGDLGTNWAKVFEGIGVTPGEEAAVELIDLYIATQLYNAGTIIPPEVDTNSITKEYYGQLGPILYLP